MDFLLVAEHEVSQNAKTLSQYASALWEIAQSNPHCYFIDGFSLNGPYATTASTFIASGGAEPGPYIVDEPTSFMRREICDFSQPSPARSTPVRRNTSRQLIFRDPRAPVSPHNSSLHPCGI